jgi:predicted phage terminase large subunit-like protein
MLDLERKKRFSTFEFSSIGSGNAGKIRAGNILYCDDLVDSIETALSKDRLDKIWQQYYTDYRQRKVGNCAELHIATRWSVHDVIGRLEDMYQNDPTAEFIVCPALDEHDESNFDYPYGLGFSTAFYREQREIMDTASWKALYMNEPIEREGQLYHPDQLQRYFELPEGEPDAILGVCDTKTTGSDYCCMPIAYQYGDRFYIEDVLFENYAPNVVEPNIVSKLCQLNPHIVRFESNVAGGKLAADVQQAVKNKGSRTKIETKWTQQNKETKILVEAPWVMEHCVFKDDSILHGDRWNEYRRFLQSLCSYSLEGKNKHDDAPDAMAQLSQFVQGRGGSRVQIMRRLF